MKIENVDLLKQWLVNVLNPIFDGDPEKLALYIVALAKKVEDDKPSRERCINDLEVFLETNTHKFVDSLFETLISKKYLTSTTPTAATSSSTSEQPPPSNSNSASSNNNSSNNSLVRLNTGSENRRYPEYNSRHSNDSKDQRSRRFGNHEEASRRSDSSYSNRPNNKSRMAPRDYNENLTRSNRSGRERHKNRSRNRTHRGADSTSSSSSSSPDTSRRSYTRSRSNSPRASALINDPNNINKKKRCRDFDEKGICTMAEYCPYDHGEVVIAPALNTQQSKYTSSNNTIDENKTNPMASNQNYPIQAQSMSQGPYNPSNSGEIYQDHHQHQQQHRGMPHMKGMRRNMNNINMKPGIYSNQPPGMVPIQNIGGQSRFPNQSVGNIQDFNQQDYQQRQMMQGNRPRNLVSIVTSVRDEDRTINQHDMAGNNYQNNQQRNMKRSYNTMNTSVNEINNQQQYNMPSMNIPPPHQEPYNPSQPHGAPLLQNPPGTLNQPQFNKPPPNFNQNPMSSSGNGQVNTNTTLVLRKVPNDLNRPELIRQHFMKFGQVMDVQCRYDNLNDATLIRFANNQQAFAAFKSPESILNNRFIRIHWLHHHQKLQNQQQHMQQKASNTNENTDEPVLKRLVKDRISLDNSEFSNQQDSKNKENKQLKGSNPSVVSEQVLVSDSSVNKTVYDAKSELVEVDQSESKTNEKQENQLGGQVLSSNFNTLTLKQGQVDKNSYAASKAINDENQKKVMLLKMQVKQKARELIEQQIKDQKLLLKKFEQAKSVEEKSQILSLVKKLSESIEKEKDILNDVAENSSNFNARQFSFQKASNIPAAPKSTPAPPHSLKLNNLRQNQTNFLKNQAMKTANSQQSKAALSPTTNPAQPIFAKAALDNRPKKLIITGVENIQEKEAILNFVNAIGCQVENSSEAEKNEASNLFSFIVEFCSRKDAEIALAKCSSSLTSKTISITWYKSETNIPVKVNTQLSNGPEDTSKSNDLNEPKLEKLDSVEQPSIENNDEENPKSDSQLITKLATNNDTQEKLEIENTCTKSEVDSLFNDSANYENIIS